MKKSTKEVTKSSLVTGIYVRVSTDEQVQEGFSIRAQVDKLKSYAMLKDWEIFDIYADEGISGKNIVDRPAINRLIDDINDGKVNNVLVFKVDRLTRSTKNLLELVELFEDNKCAFNSLTESIDTDTPSGRMFLKIIGIFAEFERENLVTRLKLGFERKAKEGYSLANNRLSYGYNKEKGQKIQTIQPDEAKIVKEIFSMYIDKNYSLTHIARTLNKRKIPTKMNTFSWTALTIKYILTNPTYVGKVRYSTQDESRYFEADGQHERLLTDEVFNAAQEKIRNMPKLSRTKYPKEDNYFCGVLACGQCGGKYTTHNYVNKAGENKCAYRCMKKTYYGNGDNACKAPAISHDKVEAAFIEYINNVNDFTEPDNVPLDDNTAAKERETLEYIAECEKKLNTLYTQRKKVMEQYVGAEIPFDEYRNMFDIFNEKCQALEGEVQLAKAEISEKDAPSVMPEDVMLNLKENWEYLSNTEKMIFLQKFIKKIVIRVDKEHAKSNTVKIERLELNQSASLEQTKPSEIRSALRKVSVLK